MRHRIEMSGLRDTRTFFAKGSSQEWEYVLTKYKDALRLKAQQKNKKPEELLKLDCWYQDELPKLIQSRKEKHVTHDELVQTMKWKLSRGKWRPRLTDLVRINTPMAVQTVSKKAFRKLPNLASAVQTLSSLKGIGPATASAVLAAGAPELAPYMADECLMAIPECQAIDYTVQEYMIFTEQIKRAVERLNANNTNGAWTPHKVEKALWTFSIINDLDPTLFDEVKNNSTGAAATDADNTEPNSPNSQNGNSDSQGEVASNSEESNGSEKRTSVGENGASKVVTADEDESNAASENMKSSPEAVEENDSVAAAEDSVASVTPAAEDASATAVDASATPVDAPAAAEDASVTAAAEDASATAAEDNQEADEEDDEPASKRTKTK